MRMMIAGYNIIIYKKGTNDSTKPNYRRVKDTNWRPWPECKDNKIICHYLRNDKALFYLWPIFQSPGSFYLKNMFDVLTAFLYRKYVKPLYLFLR